jgi:hypothetical protein
MAAVPSGPSLDSTPHYSQLINSGTFELWGSVKGGKLVFRRMTVSFSQERPSFMKGDHSSTLKEKSVRFSEMLVTTRLHSVTFQKRVIIRWLVMLLDNSL